MADDSSQTQQNRRESINNRFRNWLQRTLSNNLSEELSALLEDREELGAPLTEEERALIRAAIRFRTIEADDVAVTRNEIVYLKASMPFADIMHTFVSTGYSRLLVCGRDLDDVLGFVTLKDIVRFIGRESSFKMADVMRQCPFVPAAMSVNRVLQIMKAQRVQIAVVLDEYGGTSGLVSLKDILEELVGDIDDENDTPDTISNVRPLPGGQFELDPRMPIDDFVKIAGAEAVVTESEEDDEFETIGGLILTLAGRVPDVGERFTLADGSMIEVLDADARRIKKIKFVPYVAKAKLQANANR